MNVTMRPNGMPDVHLVSSGEYCGLVELDKQIRTLLTARRWLKSELEKQKAENLARDAKAAKK